MKLVASLILCGLLSCCHCAKILGIFPYCGYSHFSLGGKLLLELSKRGHEVTVISSFPRKTPVKNYKDIPLDGLLDFCKAMDFFSLESRRYISNIFVAEAGYAVAENVFNNPNVKNLLKSNATFDLVICEVVFHYSLSTFAHHFKAPLVLLSSQLPNEWTTSFLRHPLPYVYAPSFFSGYTYDMNTFERIDNLLLYFFYYIYEYFVVIPRHNGYLKKYMPNSPTVSELLHTVDLVFYNSHVSSTIAVPTLPNMIEIGGFHIETKPLPDDIQKFLDEAVDGAIYFSMGSHIKTTNFPIEKRMAFQAAFSQVKQRVIWKFDGDNIDGKTKNIKIKKWLPQQDILAHPNVKLFITHCGLSSVIEAVHFGVPILGLPIFMDQPGNCARAKARGMAQTLSFSNLTKDSITEVLNELLNNRKYEMNAKFSSEIMRDQDMKPMDRAIFWIEYVLRHKGAKHLQVHAIHMPWYQYYMVDLLLIAFSCITTIALICRFTIKKCKKYIVYSKEKSKRD